MAFKDVKTQFPFILNVNKQLPFPNNVKQTYTSSLGKVNISLLASKNMNSVPLPKDLHT